MGSGEVDDSAGNAEAGNAHGAAKATPAGPMSDSVTISAAADPSRHRVRSRRGCNRAGSAVHNGGPFRDQAAREGVDSAASAAGFRSRQLRPL